MARKITRTLTITGCLKSLTPLHLGGAEDGGITDMPLAVDGLGRYYLPGTSLGGAIRAFCRALDEDPMWGFAMGEDQGNASHVIVDDAPVLSEAYPELWHGNGIDRRWGTAADGIKYDREVLPKGTAFAFRLTVEVAERQDVNRMRGFLAWLVDALTAGELVLGAAGTRGFGRVKLAAVHCNERDWATPEGIFAWLGGADAVDQRAVWQAQRTRYMAPTHQRLRIAIQWQPKGPLMSRSARDGVVVDGLPFVSRQEDGQFALTLPGAGIKGAWRSHAERIVRTVLGIDGIPQQHGDQVNIPLAGDLFGRARPEDPKRGKTKQAERGKGRLGFETCYAKFALPQERWDTLDRSEADWHEPPSQQRPMALAMHVAVDRWTGGAADSRLFSAAEPMGVTWAPLVLHVDTEGQPYAELALLWLTLRDFCAGRIPLGYGVNRGYGDLEVSAIKMNGLCSLGATTDAVALKVTKGEIDVDSIRDLITTLNTAWTTWLDANNPEAVQ